MDMVERDHVRIGPIHGGSPRRGDIEYVERRLRCVEIRDIDDRRTVQPHTGNAVAACFRAAALVVVLDTVPYSESDIGTALPGSVGAFTPARDMAVVDRRVYTLEMNRGITRASRLRAGRLEPQSIARTSYREIEQLVATACIANEWIGKLHP